MNYRDVKNETIFDKKKKKNNKKLSLFVARNSIVFEKLRKKRVMSTIKL